VDTEQPVDSIVQEIFSHMDLQEQDTAL